MYKYTRIKTPVTSLSYQLSYKETTRLVYHFLNRLWENPRLKLVSTDGLAQILNFLNGTFETYNEFLGVLNQVVEKYNQDPTNIFSFQTFSKIYKNINTLYTSITEIMNNDYKYLYPNNYNPNNQYLIPQVIKILGKRVTYIVRDEPTSNQRLVDLAFNPDDAMKFFLDVGPTVHSPELVEEIQNFVQFAAENFE